MFSAAGLVNISMRARRPKRRAHALVCLQVVFIQLSKSQPSLKAFYGLKEKNWFPLYLPLTDVGATCVWYKVTSPNYKDVVHAVKVVITNRCVTLRSADAEKTYNGIALTSHIIICDGETDFVEGETVSTNFTGTITEVGVSSNDFEIVWDGTAKETNYDLTLVTGKLEVVSAAAVTVTITGRVNEVVYDGAEKSVSGYDIVSISNPMYKETDFRFGGIASTNGINAGTYPMGLKASDFVNTNCNFSSVIFNITDGKLVIAKAVNEWTTTPAIEGWTYGEASKTPVGAAKFGTVSFTYEPMPVGAAGDYTMLRQSRGRRITPRCRRRFSLRSKRSRPQAVTTILIRRTILIIRYHRVRCRSLISSECMMARITPSTRTR